MTYLELVNAVLLELREASVATVTASTYSKMVGAWVNAAKRDVEAAWMWERLRADHEVQMVPAQTTYTIPGTNSRSIVLSAYNKTQKYPLQELAWGNKQFTQYSTVQAAGLPLTFAPAGLVGGNLRVFVDPAPTAADYVVFTSYDPQADLAADGTDMIVPSQPVIEGALARAKRERGEDGGTTADELMNRYRATLADAISQEARRYWSDLVWEPV